ncbi:MAG: alternative ribosome rescue aminoacyl-tRNA hydrolase ArfB [Cyclobacteriaceae bacterium]
MIQAQQLFPELTFTTSRSGGPGGQNVNKVSSKVTMRWPVADSTLLTPEQKALLLARWRSRLTTAGELLLSSQESRSQAENKALVIDKLNHLLAQAFTPRKARKATRPTKAAKKRRVDAKKRHSEKKKWRGKGEY